MQRLSHPQVAVRDKHITILDRSHANVYLQGATDNGPHVRHASHLILNATMNPLIPLRTSSFGKSIYQT